MSYPAPNTTLSLSTRLLCYLGPPSAILLTAVASPQTALVSPLALLPTTYLYQKWRAANKRNPSRRGELEPMIWIYATAGTIGLSAVVLVQIAVVKAASALLFGSDTTMSEDFWNEFQRTSIDGLTADELTRRTQLAASWQNWGFNGALTYIAAGLAEETLKYLPVLYARRRGTPKERALRNRAYIDYVIAGALSFGVIESIGFLYASCENGGEAWPKFMLTLFERLVLGQVGHVSVGCLTALRAIRRDYYGDKLSWWSVVGPSVLFHGTYDFAAFAFSTVEGNVGWIHPTRARNVITMLGLAISMVGTVCWQVRKEWKGLDERDLAKVAPGDDTSKE